MGLDVYVGSLTRYYSGNWETVVQRYARETGTPLTVIRTNEEPSERLDAASAHQYILQWRSSLSDGLGENLSEPLDWDERADAPYFTDKPAWDCYGSLQLWAAYEEHPGLQRPVGPVEDWSEDPGLNASRSQDFRTRYPNLLLNVEFWLPIDLGFTFTAPNPAGNSCVFGSSSALIRELNDLNNRTWAAGEDQVGLWHHNARDREAPLEKSAQFAFAILSSLAAASVQNRVPMLLDY